MARTAVREILAAVDGLRMALNEPLRKDEPVGVVDRFSNRARSGWGRRRMVLALLAATLAAISACAVAAAPEPREDVALGVTFSPRHARWLGFDAEALYVEMLDELDVQYVRLPVYWDEVETSPDTFDFTTLDYYLEAARARGVNVVLSIGYKQPRWAECFPPPWASDFPAERMRQRILKLVEAEVTHARPYPNIIMWQVENEPFRNFGECGSFDVLTPDFLAQEMSLIRKLDSRPVLMTDTGELSSWITAMRLSDHYFGIALYRSLWFPSIGLWRYPVPVWFYTAKDRLVRTLLGKSGETIVIELQAEAWFKRVGVPDVPLEMQKSLFPAEMLLSNVDYARRTRFSQAYLWGVEWWYWMKEQGDPAYVETAQRIFARAGH